MDPADVLEVIQERLGYSFEDPTHLRDALTHRSFVNEHPDRAPRDNERLEYLGDAILELAASLLLFRRYGAAREGELTRRRADLVCEPALTAIARDLGLDEGLRLGKGEEKSGGRDKPRLLSSTVEAVVAAVHVDGGETRALRVARALLAPHVEELAPGELDYKSRLQEMLQAGGGSPPAYDHVDADGPDHDLLFRVHVVHRGRVIGEGQGRSKLRAEQDAARAALDALDDGSTERGEPPR